MNVKVDLFSLLKQIYVAILLAHKIKDGMALAVLISNAHLTPTTMEPNVFVQLKINVGHGKYLMDKNVFMWKVNVPTIPNGMEHSVTLF